MWIAVRADKVPAMPIYAKSTTRNGSILALTWLIICMPASLLASAEDECCVNQRASAASALNKSSIKVSAIPELLLPDTDSDSGRLRLNRTQLMSRFSFQSTLPLNFAALWWRNLRHPSFCNMVLCHGECAWNGDANYAACALVPMFPVLHEDGTLTSPRCNTAG